MLGEVLRQALGDKAGIRRFGTATVPLDEALASAVVDISGRPYLVHTGEPAGFEFHLIGGHFTGSMVRHVFEAFAYHAGICLHINLLGGRDPHHIAEAEFKALARALRQAVEPDPRHAGIGRVGVPYADATRRAILCCLPRRKSPRHRERLSLTRAKAYRCLPR